MKERFLESTFKHVTDPLKISVQSIENPLIHFEGGNMLQISKYEEEYQDDECYKSLQQTNERKR